MQEQVQPKTLTQALADAGWSRYRLAKTLNTSKNTVKAWCEPDPARRAIPQRAMRARLVELFGPLVFGA